jgi:hypothetical protein
MFSALSEPFFSIARANTELCLRSSKTFAEGVRRVNDLNREALEVAIADMRPRWESGQAQYAPFLGFANWPRHAADYPIAFATTFDATMREMMDAANGLAASDDRVPPRIDLVTEATDLARPNKNMDTNVPLILNENGEIVK